MKKCYVCGKQIHFWQSSIATYPKKPDDIGLLDWVKKNKPEKYAHSKCEPEVEKLFKELKKSRGWLSSEYS
jgi:hypothetical protein